MWCEIKGEDCLFCDPSGSCHSNTCRLRNYRYETVKEFAEKLKKKIKSLKVAEDEDYIFKCGFDVLQEDLPKIIDELVMEYKRSKK